MYGEFDCNMDDKGRIKLPVLLLRNMGGFPPYKFFLNRGFEKCLILYPEKVWEEIVNKVNTLNPFVTEERNFMRYFFRGLKDVATDNAERILVPKSLQEYAGLEKEIILFAYQGRVEIWDKDTYNAYMDHEPENFSSLADRLLGDQQGRSQNNE